MNTRVSRITQRQARLGGFAPSPSPSPEASADEDGDDGDDEDEDEDASSSNDDEMVTFSVTCPLSFVTKRGSSFE